jgi:hypothetical protein
MGVQEDEQDGAVAQQLSRLPHRNQGGMDGDMIGRLAGWGLGIGHGVGQNSAAHRRRMLQFIASQSLAIKQLYSEFDEVTPETQITQVKPLLALGQ